MDAPVAQHQQAQAMAERNNAVQREPQKPAPKQVEGDGTEATPEEQKLYDEVVMQGLEMLHDDSDKSQMIEAMRQAEYPVEYIGRMLAQTLLTISKGAEQNGIEIPGDVMFHAGMELASHYTEFGEAAGLIDENDKGAVEAVVYSAIDEYADIADIPDESRAEATEAMNSIKGKLDKSGDISSAISDTFDNWKGMPNGAPGQQSVGLLARAG